MLEFAAIVGIFILMVIFWVLGVSGRLWYYNRLYRHWRYGHRSQIVFWTLDGVTALTSWDDYIKGVHRDCAFGQGFFQKSIMRDVIIPIPANEAGVVYISTEHFRKFARVWLDGTKLLECRFYHQGGRYSKGDLRAADQKVNELRGRMGLSPRHLNEEELKNPAA